MPETSAQRWLATGLLTSLRTELRQRSWARQAIAVVATVGLCAGLTVPAVGPLSAATVGASGLIPVAARVKRAAAAQAAPAKVGPVLVPPGGFPSGVVVRGEVTGARTAKSRTYVTSTGQYLTLEYSAPVDYQDAAGVWQAIDPTLTTSTTSGLAWHDIANNVDVELPRSLGAAPVTLTAGSNWMSFRLDGAGGVGQAAGAAAIYYSAALPDVAVRYRSEDNQLKESLILAGPAAASTFTYVVKSRMETRW